MQLAFGGLMFLALGALPRIGNVRRLRRAQRSWRFALRPLYLSPLAWLGVALLIGTVSPVAGGLLAVILALGVTVLLGAGLLRGIWRLPSAVRLIGDPEAWRGKRHPYWAARADH